MSRVEKNKDSYSESMKSSNRPEDYYNERDYKRDLELNEENKKTKRING
ncbi:hypothetical protein [Staphylococcus gallinarum]|nr:hypothetical protein [Staphylococcus gallinarum]MEB7040083.1 hypothetical protein [Staphylococcus gallinarum]